MTRAEQRIRHASLAVVNALRHEGLNPTEPPSDDTRIEYGGGDYFVVTFGGREYTVTVTATYLTDEELDEERDQ